MCYIYIYLMHQILPFNAPQLIAASRINRRDGRYAVSRHLPSRKWISDFRIAVRDFPRLLGLHKDALQER